MSDSAKIIIKYFCDRFLDLDYYPSNLKTILDLELNKLRDIKKEEIEKFKKLNINTFRDISLLENQEIENLAKKANIKLSTLNNAMIAATLISNAWNKRKLYLKKPKMKVVIAGLDFAGKTSLINRLVNDYNYQDMINLEPTTGASVEEFQSERLDLILWDLGGQKDNITEYMESPERFFIQVDVLIFVFDSQDNLRYLEALKYLNDILEILKFLNENPYILILLNKADFDIIDDPDFQIQIEYLKEKISETFQNTEKNWQFEVISTSIHNFYSNEPEIATSIKKIFSKENAIQKAHNTIPNIEEKLQNIMDITLKLMNNVVSELSEIKRVLFRLVPSDISHSLVSVPFKNEPSKDISSNQEQGGKVSKKRKKDKRPQSKKMKKPKKTIGPPRRLLEHPSVNQIQSGKSEKITAETLTSIKESLQSKELHSQSKNTQQVNQLSNYPTNPPKAPPNVLNQKSTEIRSLKPPPPPKKLEVNNINQGNKRLQVLTELKDIFRKRKLVMG